MTMQKGNHNFREIIFLANGHTNRLVDKIMKRDSGMTQKIGVHKESTYITLSCKGDITADIIHHCLLEVAYKTSCVPKL